MSNYNRLPVNEPTTGKFGLVAWLESTKIELPLKGVECRFDVCGDVLDVEIDQIFHQSAEMPLECIYSFPLPAGAAVYRCEMHVNGRVIRAKVEEEGKAREIYAEKTAQGRRAAIVEVERDNLFTLTLGNVQPGDVIVVRLAYFQVLERIGAQMSVRVPVCPGVRYIPGKPLLRDLSGRGTADDTDEVPDASRISPPRIDALDPQAAYFYLEGRVEAAIAAADGVTSPTHPVFVKQAKPGAGVEISLAAHGAVPDRDFALRWLEPEARALEPHAWGFRAGGATYALTQLRAPRLEKADDDFEQDVYFLIDRSGSMKGAKWTKTCEALKAFVNVLGARDRVWITFFDTGHRDYAEKPLAKDALLSQQGFREIDCIGADGGTNLAPALGHLLEKLGAHSVGRKTTLILITDGQVGNENAIAGMIGRHPGVTMHAFGIDTAVNDALLKRLAAQQGGQCFLQTPDDDIAGTVAKLGDMIRRPVFTNITLDGNWKPASARLPDLFAGQVLDLSAVSENNTADMMFSGLLPDGRPHTATFHPVMGRNRAIQLLWARTRIDAFLGAADHAAALSLAKKYNILCRGAAFIAWDEKEQVQVAGRTVYQPAMAPGFACVATPAMPAMSLSQSAKSRSFNGPTRTGSWGDSVRETVAKIFKPGTPAPEQPRGGGEINYALWRKDVPAAFIEKIKEIRVNLLATDFFCTIEGKALLDLLSYWVVEVKRDAGISMRLGILRKAEVRFLAAGASQPSPAIFWRHFIQEHCKKSAAIHSEAVRLLGVASRSP